MRSITFENRKLQSLGLWNDNAFENYTPDYGCENQVENSADSENGYVGDEAIISRLEEIIANVKNGIYTDETKQTIYFYNEQYIDNDPEVIKSSNEAAKYIMTGWWVHTLCENQEKLIKSTEVKE